MILDKVKPASEGQRRLINALRNERNEIVGVFGPTGTGKSLLCCAYTLDALLSDKYDRFILIRPIIEAATGRELSMADLGRLFYDLALSYLEDTLKGLMDMKRIRELIEDRKIVVVDPHFLRGRTFDRDLIFVDDVQNVRPEDACEVLIRMGREARLIVAGDPILQKDVPFENDGATVLRESLRGEERAEIVELGLKDVIRPGALRGIRLLLEVKLRKRSLSQEERRIFESIKVRAPDADVLTVVDLRDARRRFEIESEHVPDALVVTKVGHLGRVVGKGGERIQAVEKELSMRIRVIELSLNFEELLSAIHPAPWTLSHVVGTDLRGTKLQIMIRRRGIGAFMGQRARYAKFIDEVVKRLIGTGVRITERR